jgi:hypothetical protein
MRERPILFNGDMVRAILEGRKTVTRRLIKPAPEMVTDRSIATWEGDPAALMRLLEQAGRKCPYGQPGDRLWVRETWAPGATRTMYRAGCNPCYLPPSGRWKPSIHMPRWASRILLEVTAVRVERLQDITEEQAIAEGIDLDALADAQDRYDMVLAWSGADGRATPITAFRDLWNSTGGDWDANPWAWVIEFRRVEAAHA